MSDTEERLRELQQLKAKQAITDSEYRERLEAILDQLTGVKAPGKKGRRSLLVLGIVGGVLVAVFFVLSIAVLSMWGLGTTSVGRSQSPYQAGSSSGLSKEAYGARVTIERIDDPAIPTAGEEKASTGKRYIAIQTAVENIGLSNIKALDPRLGTWDGHEYSPKVVPGVGASDLAFLKNLAIGDKTEGTIAFEVPDQAEVQWLRFRSNPSGIEFLFGEDN
jgi:Domain of unknown function (DUF4352)